MCWYFSCEIEVAIMFIAIFAIGLLLCTIPHHYRIRQCRKGNHVLHRWHSTGSYGGWHECECKLKVTFIHIDSF
jgi:hypothetical protein